MCQVSLPLPGVAATTNRRGTGGYRTSAPDPVNVAVGDGQATLSWGFDGQDKSRVTATLITPVKDGVQQPSIRFPAFVTAAAGPSPGQIKLSWWPADNNGSPITSYVVAPDAGYSLPWLTFTNVTGSSLVVSGLTSGTAYRFTIRATNARGWGQDSNLTAFVTAP